MGFSSQGQVITEGWKTWMFDYYILSLVVNFELGRVSCIYARKVRLFQTWVTFWFLRNHYLDSWTGWWHFVFGRRATGLINISKCEVVHIDRFPFVLERTRKILNKLVPYFFVRGNKICTFWNNFSWLFINHSIQVLDLGSRSKDRGFFLEVV